jgi:hypothetical protein
MARVVEFFLGYVAQPTVYQAATVFFDQVPVTIDQRKCWPRSVLSAVFFALFFHLFIRPHHER